jgi:hypothetical protein
LYFIKKRVSRTKTLARVNIATDICLKFGGSLASFCKFDIIDVDSPVGLLDSNVVDKKDGGNDESNGSNAFEPNGVAEGERLGCFVGLVVGNGLGFLDGLLDGDADGCTVGCFVGGAVSDTVEGEVVGFTEGLLEGSDVEGAAVGSAVVGLADGLSDGSGEV